MTLLEQAQALQQGATTSVRLTADALARATDPRGEGARVFTRLYRDAAQAQAQSADLLK